MPLTWQSVAGGVRSSDPTGLDQLITRGIATVGDAVQQLGTAPDQRRREEAARQLQMAQLAAAMSQEATQQATQYLKDKEVRDDKQAMKDFSTVQSQLEAGAREAVQSGKSLDDFLKTNETYQSLSPTARAFGAAHLSDAYFQGQQAWEQHLARLQNDRVQEQQLAIQRQNLAESRAARAEAARSRKISDDRARLELEAAQRDANDKKFLDTPLGRLTARVGTNYADATGRAYEDKDWGTLAKSAGVRNYTEYKESLNALNAERQKQGKRPLPEGAAKALLAGQIGVNTGVPSWFNEIDGFDVNGQLAMMADQYDASLREADVLVKYRKMQDQGLHFTDEQVQRDLLRANPAQADRPRSNAVMPTTTDIWNVARK